MRLISALLLLLFTDGAFAQQVEAPRYETEDEFVFALTKVAGNNQAAIEELLSTRKELVNERLWQRLIAASKYNPTSTALFFDLALQVANRLHNQRLIGATYYHIGWYEFGRGNISLAIQNYLQSKQALEQAGARRDLIYVLADLGTLYSYASDYQAAKDYSEKSLALAEQLKRSGDAPGARPDEYGVGTSLANLGNIARRNGEYERAIAYFQSSLNAYRKIAAGSSNYQANIIDDLADIGRTYSAMGDSIRALGYLNQSLTAAKQLQDLTRSAGVYNSLGILYLNQRDYQKAIDFFEQGLRSAAGVNDRFRQASLLLNLSVTYQFQKKYDDALQSFQKCLQLAKAINDKETVILINEGIGGVYREQGRYKQALDSLDEGLLMSRLIDDKIRIAEIQWRKAEVQYANGDYPAAISSSNEAVNLADQLSLQNVSYLALTTLGRAQLAQQQDALAAQSFSKAIDRIEEMRNRIVGTEQGSELFFEDKVDPYREMVQLLASQNKTDGNAQALLFGERAKGRVLADVLRNGASNLASVMTESEKEEERKLNRDLTSLNLEIARARDPVRLRALNEQLRVARLKYETYRDTVYASHPPVRRQANRAITLDDIRRVVTDDQTAFLEYVTTEARTYLFVVTKKLHQSELSVSVHPIEIDIRKLTQKANAFRSSVATRDPGLADFSRELYNLLIKPALPELRGRETICIVPDGPLWEVPFQALQAADNHFLLQDFALYYAPSIDVLSLLTKHESIARSASLSLLALGNPKLGNEVAENVKAAYRDESLAPLPEAETEVQTLKQIWGARSSRVLIGSEAAKRMFKAEAHRYQIIHLATHGILDDSNPLYSRLLMARAIADPDDDGLLEAREIMQLNLHADLVVLSACQTARGRIGAGEGVIGMSWAFLAAGARTLVVSQWKVDSISTSVLMISFHKHLKEHDGLRKAQALRQAALDLIKDKSYQHPFYWAGFVLVGNDE